MMIVRLNALVNLNVFKLFSLFVELMVYDYLCEKNLSLWLC